MDEWINHVTDRKTYRSKFLGLNSSRKSIGLKESRNILAVRTVKEHAGTFFHNAYAASIDRSYKASRELGKTR